MCTTNLPSPSGRGAGGEPGILGRACARPCRRTPEASRFGPERAERSQVFSRRSVLENAEAEEDVERKPREDRRAHPVVVEERPETLLAISLPDNPVLIRHKAGSKGDPDVEENAEPHPDADRSHDRKEYGVACHDRRHIVASEHDG